MGPFGRTKKEPDGFWIRHVSGPPLTLPVRLAKTPAASSCGPRSFGAPPCFSAFQNGIKYAGFFRAEIAPFPEITEYIGNSGDMVRKSANSAGKKRSKHQIRSYRARMGPSHTHLMWVSL